MLYSRLSLKASWNISLLCYIPPKQRSRHPFGPSLKPHVRTRKIDVLVHNNLADLEVYVHARLKDMAIGLDVDNEWPSHQLLHDFARKSEGLFIWALTVCKYPRNMTRPDKEVDKFLSDYISLVFLQVCQLKRRWTNFGRLS